MSVDEEIVGDYIPLDLIGGAGDGVLDLLGGGLGVVRGDVTVRREGQQSVGG